MNAPNPLLDRSHAAPHAERTVVHVGAIGEVPDVLARPSDQGQAVKPVIAVMAGEDKVETVAIIGAGIGGIYLASQLGVATFSV
jgi:hypothetical protein